MKKSVFEKAAVYSEQLAEMGEKARALGYEDRMAFSLALASSFVGYCYSDAQTPEYNREQAHTVVDEQIDAYLYAQELSNQTVQ